MKKYITLFTLSLLWSTTLLYGQPPKFVRDSATVMVQGRRGGTQQRSQWSNQMQTQKIAFFTNALSLTPKEAELFWPLYNQYWENRQERNREMRRLLNQLSSKGKGAKELSQQEIKSMLESYVQIESTYGSISKEYLPKFLKILSPDKVAKMFRAEDEFRMEVMQMLRNRRFSNPEGD
ncbi:MAG: hypothetical protein WC960_06850 [Bacteroidales bacterium]